MEAKEVVVVSGLVNPKITSGARYEHCTFVGVTLEYITLCNVKFIDCDFSDCYFDSTRWIACEWSKCYVNNVYANMSIFMVCVTNWLRGALNLRNSILIG